MLCRGTADQFRRSLQQRPAIHFVVARRARGDVECLHERLIWHSERALLIAMPNEGQSTTRPDDARQCLHRAVLPMPGSPTSINRAP